LTDRASPDTIALVALKVLEFGAIAATFDLYPVAVGDQTSWNVPNIRRKEMAEEFYVECPKCHHVYNVHKMIYDKGVAFSMYCPNCMHRYERKEGKIVSANFPLNEQGGK
jgi:hypothetical protein